MVTVMSNNQGALTPKAKKQQELQELAKKVHPTVLHVFSKWSPATQHELASELDFYKTTWEVPFHVLKLGREVIWHNLHFLITDFMAKAYFEKSDDEQIDEDQILNLLNAANEIRNITMALSGHKLPITEFVNSEDESYNEGHA